MFRAEKSWEMLSGRFRKVLGRPEVRRYQVVEVEEGNTVFHFDIWIANHDQTTLTYRKYISTSLAHAKDLLIENRVKKARMFVKISEKERDGYTILRIFRIVTMKDEEDFDNLLYQCENGQVYLDGIGEVTEFDLNKGKVLWEQTA